MPNLGYSKIVNINIFFCNSERPFRVVAYLLKSIKNVKGKINCFFSRKLSKIIGIKGQPFGDDT